jgi:secreted trypsin-like serine protease
MLRRKLSVLWAAAIMLVTVLVCSGVALAITFGQPDNNRHPNVGALVDGSTAYCSGTLISPTVFLTAAHCATEGDTVSVTFDSEYTSSSTTYEGTFHQDPDFSTGGGRQRDPNDIAVVVFDEPITGITPADLPTLGQLDNLDKGTTFTAVGYGVSSGSGTDGGVRRFAVSTLSATTPNYLELSQKGKKGSGGTCYGDSGGPNFLGGTNIVAAITITGDAMCKSRNSVLRLDTEEAQEFLGQYV